ncbi:M23 family metallopeptidase [Irregularibacter muris]|uniref:M23 family metallopeptidase n=1 Tax=Irregularibacter muris TaxID=1796619 RepID=A0AAE3L357_9FIRM|nr:M23 family metallopeptidase [Irregularibacter muris]MCR1899909.1 M23 family metallopeptidase [Irregularibacter muris]
MDDEKLKVESRRIRLEPKIRGRRLNKEEKVEDWEDIDIQTFDLEKFIRKNIIRLVVSVIIFALVFTIRALPLSLAQKINEGVKWSLSYQMDWKDNILERRNIIPVMGNQIKNFISPKDKEEDKNRDKKYLPPVEGVVTVPFGEGIHPVFKTKIEARGIEISGDPGGTIQAIEAGKIVQIKESTYGGKRVVLSHQSNLKSVYEGCYETSVELNQEIKQGDPLGKTKTGEGIESSIFYFELWEGDKAVNPQNYMNLELQSAN